MEKSGLSEEDRVCLQAARKRAEQLEISHPEQAAVVMAMELQDGQVITGKRSELMDAPAAALLNALKYLSHCSDEILLLDPRFLRPIRALKSQYLNELSLPLEVEEVLIALSISAEYDLQAQRALEQLPQLWGTQAHSTSFLSHSDQQTLAKLGINVTSDPVFAYDALSMM